jgi:hypothetical protein
MKYSLFIAQVIKLQDLRDRMGWLQRRFGATDNQESSELPVKESEDQVSSEGQGSNINHDPTDEKQCVAGSPTHSTNGEAMDDIVTMATNAILASGDVTIDGVTTNESDKSRSDVAANNTNSNGKNKTLEHTIMRLLHHKKDNGDGETNEEDKESPERKDEYKPDDNDYYPELGDLVSQSPDGAKSPGSTQSLDGGTNVSPTIEQRAPSTNKRKGAPPRKCLAPAEKKMAVFDTVQLEKTETPTEDSDMDEYK